MEKAALFIWENWDKILLILGAVGGFVVSPLVIFRTMRNKNRTAEMRSYIETYQVVKAEIGEVHQELYSAQDKIGKLKINLVNEQVTTISLRAENEALKARLDNCENCKI